MLEKKLINLIEQVNAPLLGGNFEAGIKEREAVVPKLNEEEKLTLAVYGFKVK